MTTFASPTPLPLHNDIRPDLEPDKEWKDALRAKIEDGLSSMVEAAQNNYQTEIGKGPTSVAQREAINRDYEEAMNNIRKLAQGTFATELERERQERRWAAGVKMIPGWDKALIQEQQDIMDRIKGARKDTRSPSVVEDSSPERPIDDRHGVEQSSSPSGYSFSSRVQNGPTPRHLAKERSERSLDRMEQGLLTSQSLQPPLDLSATPEQQRQQEEKALRIMERKERERKGWGRQEKEKERENLRKEKEEEEVKARLKEQEHARRIERQLFEREHAEKERQDMERAEKERQVIERSEKQRRELERAEKERLEKQRQIEKGILEKQRLDNERKKELEKETKEREERERRGRQERERKEREEKERREREERERRERDEMKEMERERQEMERERQEKERQKMEACLDLDQEQWERKHLERLEAARIKEESEQKERWKREEEEDLEPEKTREIRRQRDRKRGYVQETQAHEDRSQFPLNRNVPQSTDSDFSDTCDTDDLELLSPPPIQTRKESIREIDPTISRPIDNLSRRSSSMDQPAARSPPMIWKPTSVEDDVTAKPLSTELGRRSSVTSIKSSGPAGVRPVIVEEPIPERSDSEAEYLDNSTRYPELNDWHPETKSWERERRREHRMNHASDGPRGDESYEPHLPNARVPNRAEDPRPLPPRDRYDSEHNHRGLRYHRSEEIPNHPSSSVRAPLRRETSFYDEHDDKYPSSRSIRTRTSFEDRSGPLQARVPSRPSSTLNDERDYYEQAGYRSYPTPPSSATRLSIRDHMTPPSRYASGTPYGYSSEPRSNTLKYAQQAESPLSRRPSETRPSMNRGPSLTQNFSDEPSPLHTSLEYSRTYERASASIPISARQHQSSYGSEEVDGWRSWFTGSPPFRREMRREPERRDRYDQDRDEFQDTEYSSRSGREYELRHPDPYLCYGPHPEPPRRKGYSLRSPMASHPGSYHDGPDHSFGERDRTYEVQYDTDASFIDEMETDVESIPRYRDVPRHRREDNQRSAILDEEERNRWEADDWRRRTAENKRYPYEEEETRRRETKQEAMKWKDTKRQATETIRFDDDTWQREEEWRRQAAEARKAREEAIRIAEEVRIKAEEAKKKEEEAKKKEEEVSRRAMEAKRKEEEAKLKEEEARKKEAEAKKKEEEVQRQAEEARKKEEEVRRKEVAAKEEARRVREEAWQREQNIKYREEELKQREEELLRREMEIKAEKKQKEAEESRKEAERLQKQFDEEEEQRRLEEQKKREERFRYEQQQEEFRRREQEIHERKRQDSTGSFFSSSHVSSSTYPARSYSSPSATATGINGQTSSWSSSPKSGTASKASSSSAASKSRSGSMNTSFPTSTPSPHPPPPFDEAEFKRKQEEFSQQQQERFRREQLRFEETRQRTESSKLSSEQVLSILERHDRQWSILTSSATSLHWGSIPWPMFFPPQSPEDITLSAVTTYLQSPLLPDREKAKPQKDRLKEMIKKWHPDRFETKYLPRIIEGDREKLKEGTGVVIRLLNELLTKVNTPNPFGSS